MLNGARLAFPTSPKELFAIAICLAVLALAMLIGLAIPSETTSRFIPVLGALSVGVVGLLLLLRHPAWGILALPLLANTIPFEIGTGTQTGLNIAFLLSVALVLLWLLRMIVNRTFRLYTTPLNLPALLLIASFGLSMLAGQVSWDIFVGQLTPIRVQIVQLLLVIVTPGLMLMVGNTLDVRHLRWFVALFLVLAATTVTNALLTGIGVPYFFQMTVGTFPTLAVALSLGLALGHRGLSKSARLALLAIAVAWLYWGVWGAASLASAWIPPLLTILVIAALVSYRAIAVVLGLMALAFIVFSGPLIAAYGQATGGGVDLRMDLWLATLSLALKNPLLGLGPASVQPYRAAAVAFDPSLFRDLPTWAWEYPSHNQYLDIFAQTGALGLLAYLWLIIACARVAWKHFRRPADEFSRAYALAILGALPAIAVLGMIGDWMIPYIYNIGVFGYRQSVFTWVLLGGLIVLDTLSQKQANSDLT